MMWGSDYPHGDSIFPESQPILDSLFSPEEEEDRFDITVGNVVNLYKLPFDISQASAQAKRQPAVAV
jgi:hypothetical protein